MNATKGSALNLTKSRANVKQDVGHQLPAIQHVTEATRCWYLQSREKDPELEEHRSRYCSDGWIEPERYKHGHVLRPIIQFVLEAKHGGILLAEGKPEEKRDFLKKVGSNLRVAEKALSVDFRNPWQFVVDFNFSRASARADNEFSPHGEEWR
jgi:hypothetical protein